MLHIYIYIYIYDISSLRVKNVSSWTFNLFDHPLCNAYRHSFSCAFLQTTINSWNTLQIICHDCARAISFCKTVYNVDTLFSWHHLFVCLLSHKQRQFVADALTPSALCLAYSLHRAAGEVAAASGVVSFSWILVAACYWLPPLLAVTNGNFEVIFLLFLLRRWRYLSDCSVCGKITGGRILGKNFEENHRCLLVLFCRCVTGEINT